ncbi:hypothetical protein GRF29_96g163974 [Pseudopithomyces chartarum]|uniref:Inheritance of peroxisomes protein 1 n=1 Tax=Pseudopithomyces chartarum TaxID=1892770 RepID=A0AAN6RFQ5_9PLEO|nr:hypothetical protein GRF29_96g163974 [Pseudopithomyces chartarum]
MASQAPASSPANAPTNVSSSAVRRSFTLPARVTNRPPPPASQPSPDGIETLFVCASTKIVSFTTSTRRTSPSRRRSPNRDDAPTLSWRSTTDRTLAFGPLRIYRVTSSNVSFLNSGNLLHTIFPRSQCWCVDGQSIFVLRIRQDAYYRIELPHETTEDTKKISDFENVLSQVLQYERTRCPFTRGFEVELPERPKTPPRKVAPRKPAEKAKKWTFDKTWMPDNGSRPCTPVMEGSDAGTASSYDEDDASSICTDRSEPAAPDTPGTQIDATPPRPVLKSSPAPAPRLSVSERAKMFQGGRSITAPITQQRHRLSISSEVIPEEIQQRNQDEDISSTKPQLERHESTDAQSILSTNDSFYSLEPTTNRTPSPPFHDASDQPLDCPTDLTTPSPDESRGRKHTRGPSEITIRPPSPNLTLHSPPSTPPLIPDSDSDTLSLSSHTSTPPPLRMKQSLLPEYQLHVFFSHTNFYGAGYDDESYAASE